MAVLDRYLPGSTDDISGDELIERYFHLGFQHSEILFVSYYEPWNCSKSNMPDTLVSGKKCQLRS